MKRVISLFLIAVFVLCGCAPSIDKGKREKLTQEELMRTIGKYLDAAGKEIPLEEVTEGNWYKVQLTYPVDFISETERTAYEKEYEKVTVDQNNRVTVIMSREQYKDLRDNCEIAIQSDFAACMDGSLENVLPNIVDIKRDELYEEVYILTSGDIKREQVTPFAYILCRDIYRFKTLMGNNAPTTIIIMDKETQAVYGEFNDVELYEYENKENTEDGTEE